jgi:hypothetical protein
MLLRNKATALYVFAISLNILLSYAMLLYRQPFNVDGILYLKAAETYLTQGFHAAVQVYAWPFYAIFIAKLSQLVHCSLLNSAFLSNALFTSIIIIFYLLIIKEAGGTSTEQYWGLAIILLYPYLNHDRYNVLRDFGYYAFFMVSLWCFIRHCQKRDWIFALAWQCVMYCAIAFRIEGALILVLAPFCLLLKNDWPWSQRIMSVVKLHWLNIIVLIGLLIFFRDISLFNRLPGIYQTIQPQQLLSIIDQKILIMQQQVFGTFGKDDAVIFLAGGLLAVFIKVLVDTIGMLYALLAAYTIGNHRIILQNHARFAMVSYGAIITLSLMGFLSQQLFLSGRYVVPLALLLMLMIPFALSHLWQTRRQWIRLIVGTILLITAIDSFAQFGPTKSYIVNAGNWLAKNTSAQTQVYINNAQLFYYADRPGMHYPQDFQDQNWWPRLQQQSLSHYNYAAVVLRHDEKIPTAQQLFQLMGVQPTKTFVNRRDDKAYIFHLSPGQ